MTRTRWLALALAVAAALLGARALAEAVVEYRWYAALGGGATLVWRARFVALWVLRGGATLAGALFVYANLLGVVSSVETVALPTRVGGLDIAERVPAARLRWVSALVAPALAALLAAPLDGWTSVDALVTGRELGEIEPYTGHDLAFFVHWLPLENELYAWALLTLVVTAGLVVVLYALTPGLRWADGRLHLTARVRRHLTVFGAGVLLLLAWGHRLDAYALLGNGSGEGGAFTGVDQLGAMPARFVLAAVTALASLVVVRAGWANQRRLAFWTVTTVVAGALLVRAASTWVTARVVPPPVLARADAAAAANRALYTQRAFAVDRIRPAPAGYGVRTADGATVAAWDAPALARAAAGARRTEVDSGAGLQGAVGFQPAAGALAAVLVEGGAGRAGADAVDVSRTVLTLDATRADAAGRPVPLGGEPLADAGRRVSLVVHPGARGGLRLIGEPAVVGDPLVDWRVRLAHALAGRDLRVAFSGSGGRERVVARRDVLDRVAALVPFFALGAAATPLVARDSVWYAVALYSASGTYPLAQHANVQGDEWAAFRHAGTALVNAQSGAVRLVVVPDADADVRAWVRRFPGLFTPPAALPPDLARAIPPATDGAAQQAYAFAQFGARGERQPVPRRTPQADGSDAGLTGPDRGLVVLPLVADGRVVDSTAAGVVAWTLPLLSAADRVDGALVALGGADGGSLWLPAPAAAPRWQEVLDSLAGGDSVAVADEPAGARRLGALRAVPIAGDLAFARPEYRTAADEIPALVRVVGARASVVRAGASTAVALGLSVDSASPNADPGASDGLDALGRARRAYAESRAALRRGDWGAVGRALDALGAALGTPSAADTAAGARSTGNARQQGRTAP